MTNNKSMKINQFKTNLRKNINSLKIGGTNNTQKKNYKKNTNSHSSKNYVYEKSTETPKIIKSLIVSKNQLYK